MPYQPELLEEIVKNQDRFAWETVAWEGRNRGPRWYLIMILIAAVGVIYAILVSNFLFAFLILLASIILIVAGNQEQKRILVQIGDAGVVVDGRLYEYKDLNTFSIIYHPPQTKLLYIEPRGVMHPRVRLLLEEQNPVEIRSHLKQYLQENLVLQEEYLSDILARLLKI
jgi:hypothetical protein